MFTACRVYYHYYYQYVHIPNT